MSSTDEPVVVRVSRKGQATIPKSLREKFGIETPGEVFVYEADGRIVLEPVPSLDELHGIHAGDHEPGEVLAKVRELRDEEERREEERADRLRPSEGFLSETNASEVCYSSPASRGPPRNDPRPRRSERPIVTSAR